jgi:hypothetical protein
MAPRSLWILLFAIGCSRHPTPAPSTSNDAGIPPKAVDRLLPGELGQSKLLVFGFPVPQGMNVERRYADSVHLVGTVSPTALTAYVRAHAATGPAELIGSRKIFRKVPIRGGDPSRLYDIEIDDSGAARRLIVSDVTQPPMEPGLSVEERWKRAGYNPDGTPIASAEPR